MEQQRTKQSYLNLIRESSSNASLDHLASGKTYTSGYSPQTDIYYVVQDACLSLFSGQNHFKELSLPDYDIQAKHVYFQNCYLSFDNSNHTCCFIFSRRNVYMTVLDVESEWVEQELGFRDFDEFVDKVARIESTTNPQFLLTSKKSIYSLILRVEVDTISPELFEIRENQSMFKSLVSKFKSKPSIENCVSIHCTSDHNTSSILIVYNNQVQFIQKDNQNERFNIMYTCNLGNLIDDFQQYRMNKEAELEMVASQFESRGADDHVLDLTVRIKKDGKIRNQKIQDLWYFKVNIEGGRVSDYSSKLIYEDQQCQTTVSSEYEIISVHKNCAVLEHGENGGVCYTLVGDDIVETQIEAQIVGFDIIQTSNDSIRVSLITLDGIFDHYLTSGGDYKDFWNTKESKLDKITQQASQQQTEEKINTQMFNFEEASLEQKLIEIVNISQNPMSGPRINSILENLIQQEGPMRFRDQIKQALESISIHILADSLCHTNHRTLVQEGDDGLVKYYLRHRLRFFTKLDEIFYQHLDANVFSEDVRQLLNEIQVKLQILIGMRDEHNQLFENDRNGTELVNGVMGEVVKILKESKDNFIGLDTQDILVKQRGLSDILLFYSRTIPSINLFYHVVAKAMQIKYIDRQEMDIDTLKPLMTMVAQSILVPDKDVVISNWFTTPKHSKQSPLDDCLNIIQLTSEILKRTKDQDLFSQLCDLVNSILKTLQCLTEHKHSTFEQNRFIHIRSDLIQIVEEFDQTQALSIAVNFLDIVHTTRIAIDIRQFNAIHESIELHLRKNNEAMNEQYINKSFEWIISNWLQMVESTPNRGVGETKAILKCPLFDIYEQNPQDESNKYRSILEKFLAKNDQNQLLMIMYMRRGQLDNVQYYAALAKKDRFVENKLSSSVGRVVSNILDSNKESQFEEQQDLCVVQESVSRSIPEEIKPLQPKQIQQALDFGPRGDGIEQQIETCIQVLKHINICPESNTDFLQRVFWQEVTKADIKNIQQVSQKCQSMSDHQLNQWLKDNSLLFNTIKRALDLNEGYFTVQNVKQMTEAHYEVQDAIKKIIGSSEARHLIN